ncbi:MAG: hypothetical protein WDA07_14260 [Leucobacter sp.]
MANLGWAVGGMIPHSAESARRALYASTGGMEGVGSGTDLRVMPLATPGQGVRVLVGTALIRSRFVASETETYQGAVITQETVSTTPTGSGSSRSDLVVMMVEDPYANGSTWPEPGDPTEYNPFPIRVVSGVPAGTTRLQDVPGYQNHTAATLARIDFPPSTGTVTAGMIHDLRVLVNPRRHDVKRAIALNAGEGNKLAAGGDFHFFPAAERVNKHEILVPEWATVMQIEANWYGIKGGPGKVWGASRVRLWPVDIVTQTFGYETPDTSDHKACPMAVADTLSVPSSIRGTVQGFYLAANVANQSGADPRPYADEWSSVKLNVTFYEDRSQITS